MGAFQLVMHIVMIYVEAGWLAGDLRPSSPPLDRDRNCLPLCCALCFSPPSGYWVLLRRIAPRQGGWCHMRCEVGMCTVGMPEEDIMCLTCAHEIISGTIATTCRRRSRGVFQLKKFCALRQASFSMSSELLAFSALHGQCRTT